MKPPVSMAKRADIMELWSFGRNCMPGSGTPSRAEKQHAKKNGITILRNIDRCFIKIFILGNDVYAKI